MPRLTLPVLSDAMTGDQGAREGRRDRAPRQPLADPVGYGRGLAAVWDGGVRGRRPLRLVGRARQERFLSADHRPDNRFGDVRSVRAAAQRPERDPSSITMCVAAPSYVGDDVAQPAEQLRWFRRMVRQPRPRPRSPYGPTARAARLTDYTPAARPYDIRAPRPGRNPPRRTFVPDPIGGTALPGGSPAAAHIERLRELSRYRRRPIALYPHARLTRK